VIPGTTPAASDDDGGVDPALAPLLATGTTEEVGLALLGARLLVPVVALRSDGEAEMAVPALVNETGRRALPVFSSYDALRAWRADARPVPMSGARVMAAARSDHYDGVVLDVAGPHPFTFAIG
jgi:SseB protein N-terminal domain